MCIVLHLVSFSSLLLDMLWPWYVLFSCLSWELGTQSISFCWSYLLGAYSGGRRFISPPVISILLCFVRTRRPLPQSQSWRSFEALEYTQIPKADKLDISIVTPRVLAYGFRLFFLAFPSSWNSNSVAPHEVPDSSDAGLATHSSGMHVGTGADHLPPSMHVMDRTPRSTFLGLHVYVMVSLIG